MNHYCLQLAPIPLADGETLVLEDARGVVIEGATKSLNELRVHCPATILQRRVRPFLDRSLVCLCAGLRRERKATA